MKPRLAGEFFPASNECVTANHKECSDPSCNCFCHKSSNVNQAQPMASEVAPGESVARVAGVIANALHKTDPLYHKPAPPEPQGAEAPANCNCGDGGCIECYPQNRNKESLIKHYTQIISTLREQLEQARSDVWKESPNDENEGGVKWRAWAADLSMQLAESPGKPRSQPEDDWRKLSVTAIAAENSSVAEYIEQLETGKAREVIKEVFAAAPRPQEPSVNLEVLANQVSQEIWKEAPITHGGTLRCWPGTDHIAEKIKKHFAQFFSPAQSPQELLAALEKIAYYSVDCRCLHNDENCCVAIGAHCPVCIAAVALRCKCPNQADEDGAYCPLCGKLKGPAQSQGAAPLCGKCGAIMVKKNDIDYTKNDYWACQSCGATNA